MALEILTVGAAVKYCVETTAGERPTTGYTVIPDIVSAPGLELTPETIDVSNLSDYFTRYALGRQDTGGDVSFTANHTDNFIAKWKEFVEKAEEARKDGKSIWIEYAYPGAKNSFFWSGMPAALGNGGMEGNAASTIPAHVVPSEIVGWAAASTEAE